MLHIIWSEDSCASSKAVVPRPAVVFRTDIQAAMAALRCAMDAR